MWRTERPLAKSPSNKYACARNYRRALRRQCGCRGVHLLLVCRLSTVCHWRIWWPSLCALVLNHGYVLADSWVVWHFRRSLQGSNVRRHSLRSLVSRNHRFPRKIIVNSTCHFVKFRCESLLIPRYRQLTEWKKWAVQNCYLPLMLSHMRSQTQCLKCLIRGGGNATFRFGPLTIVVCHISSAL